MTTGIGVVGLGWWGPKVVRNCLLNPAIATVVGCDPDPQRQQTAKAEAGIEVVASIDDLLDDPRITAIAITSPPATHSAIARKALQAGRHVLTEKPPAASVAELDELIALAKARSLTYMMDSTWLYAPPVMRLRQLFETGFIKRPSLLQFLRYGDNLRRDGIGRLRTAMRPSNTDAIADLVYHDLAILIYLLDEDPTAVSVSTSASLWPDLCDTAHLQLRIGECPVHIGLSWTLPERRRDIVIFDPEKMVIYDDLAADKLSAHWSESGEREVIALPQATQEPLGHMIEHFVECTVTGAVPRSGPAFMRRVLVAYERIQAARNRTPVDAGQAV